MRRRVPGKAASREVNMEAMIVKRSKPNEISNEIPCPECDGSGFPAVMQPKEPGRKIFPAPCKHCHGKGRVIVEAVA